MPPTSSDGLYSMRVVTRMTGLTADTIRAWERRYGAVEPDRSKGNTRRFSADDVRRLAALREATQRGHSISSIATLPLDRLAALAGDDEEATGEVAAAPLADAGQNKLFAMMRDNYLRAIAKLDARGASDILDRCATLLAPHDVVFEVVLPLVQEIGRRWGVGEARIAQEHLVTAQMTALVDRMIRRSVRPRGPKVLLTTPAGHRHSIGILLAALIAAVRDCDTIFLGADLPDKDLIWIAKESNADILVMGVVKDLEPGEGKRIAAAVAEIAVTTEVWIGVPNDHELVRVAPSARYFHRFEDLDVAFSNRAG